MRSSLITHRRFKTNTHGIKSHSKDPAWPPAAISGFYALMMWTHITKTKIFLCCPEFTYLNFGNLSTWIFCRHILLHILKIKFPPFYTPSLYLFPPAKLELTGCVVAQGSNWEAVYTGRFPSAKLLLPSMFHAEVWNFIMIFATLQLFQTIPPSPKLPLHDFFYLTLILSWEHCIAFYWATETARVFLNSLGGFCLLGLGTLLTWVSSHQPPRNSVYCALWISLNLLLIFCPLDHSHNKHTYY